VKEYVDPEGPDGWIKDPCSYCGARSGKKCRRMGSGVELPGPHATRERTWAMRRAREQSGE
jgi:hypothetical protein